MDGRDAKGGGAGFAGCAVLAAVLLWGAMAQAEPTGLKVIAHPSVPGSHIRKDVLAAVFLGQMTRWGGGEAIRAVDRSSQTPLRASFSTDVLSQPVAAVKAYWVREIARGRARPPVTKGSDDEVIAFVRETSGAIGYVSADATLDAGVKELPILP